MMKETKQEGKERFVKEKGGVRKMKRYREKERGITLVALVITIVLNCSCLATERNKRIAKI